MTTAPAVVVRFVARQLGVDPAALAGYGDRAQTRTDHVNQVKAYLVFRSPSDRSPRGHGYLDLHRPHPPANRAHDCRNGRDLKAPAWLVGVGLFTAPLDR